MISIKGLAKKYDSLLVVDGIDLEIPKGGLFGFPWTQRSGKNHHH